jgi:hypothetical protein
MVIFPLENHYTFNVRITVDNHSSLKDKPFWQSSLPGGQYQFWPNNIWTMSQMFILQFELIGN